MDLTDVSRIFYACVKDSLVFDRDVAGGGLVEVDTLRKENKEWLVVAAGVGEGEASVVFPNNQARAERATVPLSVFCGGQVSFCYVVRGLEWPIEEEATFLRAAHFAPRDGVPLVEIRSGYFRLSNLPGHDIGVTDLRWEIDFAAAQADPLEEWLRPWKRIMRYNPGHAPSHIHFNSPPIDVEAVGRDRSDHSPSELRLAVGMPNPLALILSVAAWIRRQH